MAAGVSHREQAAVTTSPNKATSNTGGRILQPGTPAARRPVISPSLDIRLSTINVPTSTPTGTVNVNTGGRTSRKR
jgi:hypothetical protein